MNVQRLSLCHHYGTTRAVRRGPFHWSVVTWLRIVRFRYNVTDSGCTVIKCYIIIIIIINIDVILFARLHRPHERVVDMCVFRDSPSHSSLLLPGYWKPPSLRERMVRWSLHFHHTHFHCFTECSLHRCNFLLNGCGLSNTQSKPLLFRHDNTRSVFILKRKRMWCTGRFVFFFF